MTTEKKSYEDLWNEANDVQDACNLSGVVHSFSRAMTRLWEIAREEGKGTEWVNSNPVTRLYASKITHLAGELEVDDVRPLTLD